jgi:hypothetical protein
LDLPQDDPEQVSEEPAGSRAITSRIKVEDASPGWNSYYDPTHIKKDPILQPVPSFNHQRVEDPLTKGLTKPEVIGTGDIDERILEAAARDLEQRGLLPSASPSMAPAPGMPTPSMSPRFASKYQRAKAAWLSGS